MTPSASSRWRKDDARLQLLNPLIHHRLSHHGFISFVVTVAAVADKIDNHVFAELVSPIHSQLGDEHHGFRVVAIDVENGC